MSSRVVFFVVFGQVFRNRCDCLPAAAKEPEQQKQNNEPEAAEIDQRE
jgi:hypothetical protein